MKFEDRFKFRIWDVQNQKYHFLDLTKTTDIDDLAFFANDIVPDYNEQVKCPDSNCWALIIEQCTGLKDNNGKLIYEGDVLTHENIYDGHIKIKVVFNTDGFYTEYLNGNPFNFLSSVKPLNVIGNIHQNGNLLKRTVKCI